MYYRQHWVIQWDRVNTLEDLKTILQALNLSFEPNCPTLTAEAIRLCALEDKPVHGLTVMD